MLRATRDSRGGWHYEYEKPGHGWVQRLTTRQPTPTVDGAALAAQLEAKLGGSRWKAGGSGGLVAICTARDVAQSPEEVATALLACDPGAAYG